MHVSGITGTEALEAGRASGECSPHWRDQPDACPKRKARDEGTSAIRSSMKDGHRQAEAEIACRIRADAGARGLNPAGLFGTVNRTPCRLAALSAGRATLRPEVTRASSPCHAACAMSPISAGRFRKLRAAKGHRGEIRDDRNERRTNRRGARAHRRQPESHC